MSRLATLDKPDQPRTASEDRAAEVFLTAADLIYRNGFDATSMSDIAAAVNLTKAGLYYYTKGKLDLLFQIMEFAMDCIERDIVDPCSTIEDPETRLREMIARHLRTVIITGGGITLLTEEDQKLPPTRRTVIATRKRRYFDLARNTLVELKGSGRLRPIDASAATHSLFSTFLGLARWYRPDGRLSGEEAADETAHFILAGLLKDE